MKVLKIAVAAGVLAGAAIVGPAAVAAGTQAGGPIKVFVTNTSSTKGKILVTGAIGDYGTTVSVDKNGKADPNGNFEKVTLKQGGFWVDATGLNKKLNSAQPQVNTATCSAVFGGTGTGQAVQRHRRLRGNRGHREDHRHVRGDPAAQEREVQLRQQRAAGQPVPVDHRQRPRVVQLTRFVRRRPLGGAGPAGARATATRR